MSPETEKKSSIVLDADDKLASVMIYTNELLTWGDVVIKTSIRTSTWLRSASIPQFIHLHNATALRFSANGMTRPQQYKELFLPSKMVIAFHIKPPASDPLDYDVNEPMRRMVPTTALVGMMRFDGYFRMSMHTDVPRFLEVGKEAFLGMYDIKIYNPNVPAMTPIQTPFVLLRQDQVLFSPRDEPAAE